jgi:hypothetical protein
MYLQQSCKLWEQHGFGVLTTFAHFQSALYLLLTGAKVAQMLRTKIAVSLDSTLASHPSTRQCLATLKVSERIHFE